MRAPSKLNPWPSNLRAVMKIPGYMNLYTICTAQCKVNFYFSTRPQQVLIHSVQLCCLVQCSHLFCHEFLPKYHVSCLIIFKRVCFVCIHRKCRDWQVISVKTHHRCVAAGEDCRHGEYGSRCLPHCWHYSACLCR